MTNYEDTLIIIIVAYPIFNNNNNYDNSNNYYLALSIIIKNVFNQIFAMCLTFSDVVVNNFMPILSESG